MNWTRKFAVIFSCCISVALWYCQQPKKQATLANRSGAWHSHQPEEHAALAAGANAWQSYQPADHAAVATGARVWSNPFSVSSPAYREAEDYHQWMLSNKKLDRTVSGGRETDRLQSAAQIMSKGMPRLPTALLEQYLPLVGRVLASLDTDNCGAFVKGTLSASKLMEYGYPVIESFNSADAKTWFAINRSAIEAELDNSPLIVLTSVDAIRGVLMIKKSLPDSQSRLFISGLAGLKTEDNDKACTTIRILFYKGESLSEPYRGYIARLLLTGHEGHETL
jgi:hypothetical protein